MPSLTIAASSAGRSERHSSSLDGSRAGTCTQFMRRAFAQPGRWRARDLTRRTRLVGLKAVGQRAASRLHGAQAGICCSPRFPRAALNPICRPVIAQHLRLITTSNACSLLLSNPPPIHQSRAQVEATPCLRHALIQCKCRSMPPTPLPQTRLRKLMPTANPVSPNLTLQQLQPCLALPDPAVALASAALKLKASARHGFRKSFSSKVLCDRSLTFLPSSTRSSSATSIASVSPRRWSFLVSPHNG